MLYPRPSPAEYQCANHHCDDMPLTIFTKALIGCSTLPPPHQENLFLKGTNIRLAAAALGDRGKWSKPFSASEEIDFSPRILYPAKLSIKCEGQINHFRHIRTHWPPYRLSLGELLKDVPSKIENESKKENTRDPRKRGPDPEMQCQEISNDSCVAGQGGGQAKLQPWVREPTEEGF